MGIMARQFKPGQLQTGSLFNISSSYALTASFALNGGGGAAFPFTGNAQITGSLVVTGSVIATGGITGSLFGTASNATQAVSASYAISSSFSSTASIALQVSTSISTQNLQHNVLFVDTSGPGNIQVDGGLRYNPNQNLLTTTSSYTIQALSSSFASTSSYVQNAQTASYVLNAISSSFATTASFALNAGGGGSFPYTGSAIISGSLAVTGSVRATAGFTGSLQGNADTATNASTAGQAAIAVAPLNDWIPGKPDVNNISPYSLGSPTSWWNSLYVGHGTIYFMSQSVGQPTTSASISIKDNAFTFNTTDAQGNTSETVITDAGASLAISASIAATASYIDPTFISQSAAASGFGGGSISYVSSSNNPLSEIEVADYDNNVAVTYVNGRLKFIFGTPTVPSAPTASFNSTFATDRFNKVTDAYTVTGTIAVGGYTLISASLYEGGVLLTSTGSNATQLLYNTTTTGSHTYVLHVTASSPLDNSLNIQSASLSGTLSKTNPGSPTITPTVTVQLGLSGLSIEQGATGSITFTSASGTANDWTHNFTSTNVSSPIFVTGSATGSSSITATATSYYSSSGVLGADNFPARIITSTNSFTYTKIRSVRYGVSAVTAFTSTQLENLATWDTTIGGTIGRVVIGTTNPHTYQFTITTSGQYIYIVVDSSYSLTGILNVNNSNSNDLGVFTATTIGNYKVYRSNNISATTILYELRTS